MNFTAEQQKRVDEARTQFHFVVMDVLKESSIDFSEIDLTEAGESIALENTL